MLLRAFLCVALLGSSATVARAQAPDAAPVPRPAVSAAPTAPAAPDPVPFKLPSLQNKVLFKLLAHAEAEKAGLPFDLVDAVMKIESDYQPDRIGGVGEIGLMQVRLGTAQMLGFHGAADALADPAVNIHYGTAYLGEAWRLTKGDVCRTLMKYRAGHGQETMSALSVNYCSRARDHLAALGSPLVATINPQDLIAAPVVPVVLTTPDVGTAVLRARPTRHGGAAPMPRSGPAFWAAFQAKIKVINTRIETKWRRTASR